MSEEDGVSVSQWKQESSHEGVGFPGTQSRAGIWTVCAEAGDFGGLEGKSLEKHFVEVSRQ